MISAWMRGDPHFTTMDGLTYTFNGRGEFVLLRTYEADGTTISVEIQVRFYIYIASIQCNDASNTGLIENQGSHTTWKTWKSWKNESIPGKPGIIMEFCKI